MIDGWEAVKQKPQKYKAGSTGPDDALGLLIKDGRKWQDFEG